MLRKILLVALIITTILWTAFIFSNSLDNAEESTEKSSTVTETVNKIAASVGIEKEITHKTVRDMAHFSEFSLLSVLLCLDILLLLSAKISRKIFISVGFCSIALPSCFLLACADELIQKFSSGRASQFSDVLLDTLGAICGFACFSVVYIVLSVIISKKLGRIRSENQ